MMFEVKVQGKIIDVRKTKKDKDYIVVYDEKNGRTINVFVKDINNYAMYDDVDMNCRLITDKFILFE
ncbi:MAG: hypothetical protein ACPLKS_07405 [Caldisericum exile]|uniref:hypothetical protein n=1 Tax=Caldisericum exile TaxID=693075 RepID=UPI003C75776A